MKILAENIRSEMPGTPKMFIGCASFEARTLTIGSATRGVFEQAILFLPSGNSKAAENARRFRSVANSKARLKRFTAGNPFEFARAATEVLDKAQLVGSVFLDITTFTRENLQILLRMMRETRSGIHQLIIGYNAAATYRSADTVWLTRGYGSVRSVLGYPGALAPSRGEHLIVMAGFEVERSLRLIKAYEPALLSVGHCTPASAMGEEIHRTNVSLHSQISRTTKGVRNFTFSCSNPLATRDELLALRDEATDYNTVIAAMNNKLSAVGAALAAMLNTSIQLCYLPAVEYNQQSYSTPSEDCYMFDVTDAIFG